MSAWCTVADVLDITGKTVTDADIAPAQSVIEAVTNRTPDASGSFKVRDFQWLRQAVAWQTVWQMEQPDFYSRSLSMNVQQDGLGVDYAGDVQMGQVALLLAPLAARVIKNLSWFGSRGVRIAPPRRINRMTEEEFLTDSAEHDWEPM